MNEEWIVDEEVLSWIISLCDLEQSYILSILGRSSKQIKIISSHALPSRS
jgi:hypothetical protein